MLLTVVVYEEESTDIVNFQTRSGWLIRINHIFFVVVDVNVGPKESHSLNLLVLQWTICHQDDAVDVSLNCFDL